MSKYCISVELKLSALIALMQACVAVMRLGPLTVQIKAKNCIPFDQDPNTLFQLTIPFLTFHHACKALLGVEPAQSSQP